MHVLFFFSTMKQFLFTSLLEEDLERQPGNFCGFIISEIFCMSRALILREQKHTLNIQQLNSN